MTPPLTNNPPRTPHLELPPNADRTIVGPAAQQTSDASTSLLRQAMEFATRGAGPEPAADALAALQAERTRTGLPAELAQRAKDPATLQRMNAVLDRASDLLTDSRPPGTGRVSRSGPEQTLDHAAFDSAIRSVADAQNLLLQASAAK